MRKTLKVAGFVFAGLVVVVLGVIIYFNTAYPNVDAPTDLVIESTPERIARGKYIAEHVSLCTDCHSTRDWSYFAGPVKENTLGIGGERFGEEMGLPGTVYSKNITPAGLKGWSDGEILRAITSGIRKNGDVLFPVMPYTDYNKMAQEDLYSVIAYIKTLKPVENKIPESSINFPVNILIRTAPQSYTAQKSPDKSNSVAYGKYLTQMAGCAHCHSNEALKDKLEHFEFAGGTEINLPMGTLRTANITPDEKTGIGKFTKEQFIARFKSFATPESRKVKVQPESFNTIMPWTNYAGMTEEDLGAIYDYLRTVPAVSNKVQIFTPAKSFASK